MPRFLPLCLLLSLSLTACAQTPRHTTHPAAARPAVNRPPQTAPMVALIMDGHIAGAALIRQGRAYLRDNGRYVPLSDYAKRNHATMEFYADDPPMIVLSTAEYLASRARMSGVDPRIQ